MGDGRTLILLLDRPIDQLIEFAGLKSILPTNYNIRQMIAHEVDVIAMRKEEESLARRFKDNIMLPKKTTVKRDVDLTNLMAAGRAKAEKQAGAVVR